MFQKVKRSIKYSYINKQLLSITVIVTLLFIIFNLITYFRATALIDSNKETEIINYSDSVVSSVNEFFIVKTLALKQIAANNEVKNFIIEASPLSFPRAHSAFNDVNKLLTAAKDFDSDVSSVWIVSDSRKFKLANGAVYSSPEKYDIKSQEWYSTMVSEGTSNYLWYSSSQKNADGEDIMSAVSPIIDNGNVIGYAGIDILMEKAIEIFKNIPVKDGFYPIIITDSGAIIYSSDKLLTEKYVANTEKITKVIEDSTKSTRKITPITLNGTKNYITYQKQNLTNWNFIVIYDSLDAATGERIYFIQEIIILVCFTALMAVAISNRLTHSFKSVMKILKSITQISNGNYSVKIKSPLQDEIGQISNAIDTMSGELEEKIKIIEHYAYYDSLTGLSNRNKLIASMNEYIVNARENYSKFAVISLDIDNFKWINDTLGHNFGDEYLKIFAETLNDTIGNRGILSRFSGDEFVFVIPFQKNVAEIIELINRIKLTFSKPIKVYTDVLYVKFSLGVSIFPDDDITEDLLLRDADIAMNIAKEHEIECIEFYNNSLHKAVLNKALIAQKLTSALNNNEFYLNYQPILTATNHDIYGFEVLLRWTNSELGTTPPGEFIPVAEETGIIVPIGTWIFESACRFHKVLCERYNKDLIISINVSPQQLIQQDYVENIKRVLNITQINPALIQIEITENTLVTLFSTANDVLMDLCDLGITIALDDFGTGYSSLNYLKSFPINCLKIDKSFVDEIYNNTKDYAITDSIIDLVHTLNITTIAEGVETEGQLKSLNNMNCDMIQGFLMSKPLTEKMALEFIDKYDVTHRPI